MVTIACNIRPTIRCSLYYPVHFIIGGISLLSYKQIFIGSENQRIGAWRSGGLEVRMFNKPLMLIEVQMFNVYTSAPITPNPC